MTEAACLLLSKALFCSLGFKTEISFLLRAVTVY